MMNEAEEEQDPPKLYKKDVQFEDANFILQGKRAPFVKQKFAQFSETNIMSPGIMCEYNYYMFAGCKDGSIRSLELKQYDESEVKVRQWIPHQEQEIRVMSMCQGYLFTLAETTNEFKVWDIKDWVGKDIETPPKCVLTANKVYCFDIRPSEADIDNPENVLYICYEKTIECRKVLDVTNKVELTKYVYKIKIPKRCEFIAQSRTCTIFLYGNKFIRRTKDEEKTILAKNNNQRVKSLFIDLNILTIVIDDTNSKTTVIKFINLEKMQKIMQQTIEAKKKREQEQQRLQREGGPPMKQEEEKSEEELRNEYLTSIEVSDIGECQGAYESLNYESRFIVTGQKGFIIIDNQKILHIVETEFDNSMSIFSGDDNFVIMLGTDGKIRYVDWTINWSKKVFELQEKEIDDVCSTNDGKLFALLTENQQTLTVYNYEDITIKKKEKYLSGTYLMRFSSNSESLIIVSSTAKQGHFEIMIMSMIDSNQNIEFTIQIDEESYPIQIDCCVKLNELYVLSKQEISCSLMTFNFDKSKKDVMKNISCFALSHDEKLLAWADISGLIFMRALDQTQIINQIKTNEELLNLNFFTEGHVIVVQSKRKVLGINYFTHEILWKIQEGSSNHPLSKLTIVNDELITFLDVNFQLCTYDISLKDQQFKVCSNELDEVELIVDEESEKIFLNYPWACVGNHIVMQIKLREKKVNKKDKQKQLEKDQQMNSGEVTQRNGEFTKKNTENTTRNQDNTRRNEDFTKKNGDITRKNGDTTRKNQDTPTEIPNF